MKSSKKARVAAFLNGMGSVLAIYPEVALPRRHLRCTCAEHRTPRSDARALRLDAEAIGMDMRAVLNRDGSTAS